MARRGTGRRTGAVILSCVLAGGCAGLSPGMTRPGALPVDASPTTAEAARPYHDTIDIAGRLSLRYDQNGSEQALDGKFTWAQSGGLTRITLLTPFGQTLATIDVTPQVSTLRQADRLPRSEANVDALITTALGWPLPVAGLRDWLQGFAMNEQGTRQVATAGAVGDATYVKTADGWLLHYPVWETPAAGAPASPASHPKRIDLQRLTTQAGKVALRIVIDQWQPR